MDKDKKKMVTYIAIGILILFLLSQCKEKKQIVGGEEGDDVITDTEVKQSGGGGGSGGVPSNGDPDEPCENCDLFWVENALSSSNPPFNIPEYLTRDGRLVPSSNGNAPQGHWECRGECPLKNGYKQICKPRPKLIDIGQMGRPTSRRDIEIDCFCTLEEPCHLEFGNIFCERGIPEDKLRDILTSNVEGKYIDVTFSKIREHCKIAKCDGGCAVTGERCVFETTKTDFGDFITTCKCKGDTCRKEYITLPTKVSIINNINYRVIDGVAKISDFTDVTQVVSSRLPFRCAGECIENNKQCLKEGDNCVCKTPEGPMPLAQPCSAVEVSGDNDWYKCLRGYCDQVPYCYPVGVSTPGWYMGRTLVKADNDCAQCVAYCGAIGTRSQGWYDSCDDSLITWDNTCNSKSPCFYNTYTNKCECTPYTKDCAWEVDWNSFSGKITDSNKPTRHCEGNCPYQTNVIEECKRVDSADGEICKCTSTPSQDPCNSICINLNIGYKTGRTIQSYSECTNTVEVPYTASDGTMCCCSFATPTQDKCIGICQSGGYTTGWTISSFIECNPPYVGYTQNYNDLCCCTPQSSGGGTTPDMDNDGIPDNQDSCPTRYGTRINNGCPTLTTTTPITQPTISTFWRR